MFLYWFQIYIHCVMFAVHTTQVLYCTALQVMAMPRYAHPCTNVQIFIKTLIVQKLLSQFQVQKYYYPCKIVQNLIKQFSKKKFINSIQMPNFLKNTTCKCLSNIKISCYTSHSQYIQK